jgi:hypothetical protein
LMEDWTRLYSVSLYWILQMATKKYLKCEKQALFQTQTIHLFIYFVLCILIKTIDNRTGDTWWCYCCCKHIYNPIRFVLERTSIWTHL